MQMNNLITQSKNFHGESKLLLREIKSFLEEVSAKHPQAKHFHLVHALVFKSSMTEAETLAVNDQLSQVYRETGFTVLGGDTSSGNELNIFISAILY
jgi:hypothetical protein